MPGPIVLFAGPTLAALEASAMLPAAVCLPPAAQGSLVRAVRDHRPAAIALIDGAFGRVPAVRHKEILWVLSRGTPVFGASSMGALRAAELASFGMRGCGLVYRWYRRNPLADDDEVAVAMMPVDLGGGALSEALINMRFTLRRAERQGFIDVSLRRGMEELARSTHFTERTYPRLLADALAGLSGASPGQMKLLEKWLPGHAVDRKRTDALELLSLLAGDPDVLRPPVGVPPFRMTEAWALDLDAAGLWPGEF